MKLKNSTLVISIIIILFGGILLSNQMGSWQTESNKQPKKFETGEFEGMPNPEDIRGSYYFSDIENAFNIEAKIIAQAFNIDTDDPKDLQAKDLEELYSDLDDNIEIGTGSIKQFVALFTGLPYEGEDYILDTAVEVLKENGKWSDEIELEIKERIINSKDININEVKQPLEENKEEVEHNDEMEIKGKTTIKEAIVYGITKEKLEEILDTKIENENLLIRDICEEKGLSFGNIKDELNSLLK